MGKLEPESSATVPSDHHHEETPPPVNQPPAVPAVTTEITANTSDSSHNSPPNTPPTVPVDSDHHEEIILPVTESPPAVPAVTDSTSHRSEIQQLLETPQPPPKRHDTYDVELLSQAVAFPPQPQNQIVPYTYTAPAAAGGSGGGNNINAQPQQAGVAGNGQLDGYKPVKEKAPRVMLIPFIGVPWTSGLFDCCQHPRNAIITTIAPCVTFGQITEILDNGSTSCLAGGMLYFFLFLVICHWNIGDRSRRRMRNAFGLAESPVTDRIAHTMFPLCALCQEFRELNNRGYDPFLGYKGVIAGIVHDPSQVVQLNPPNQPPMHRSS